MIEEIIIVDVRQSIDPEIGMMIVNSNFLQKGRIFRNFIGCKYITYSEPEYFDSGNPKEDLYFYSYKSLSEFNPPLEAGNFIYPLESALID